MNHWIDYELNRLNMQKDEMLADIRKLENAFGHWTQKLEEHMNKMSMAADKVGQGLDAYKAKVDRAALSENRKLKKRIEELEAQLEQVSSAATKKAIATVAVKKARTIAIFDSILFNISNWSKQGDTAPDFELISQAVLFPSVYERVMSGNEDAYILDEVPASALEVVRRGRQYIKAFRKECELSLVEPATWDTYLPLVQQWWVNDGLPLIYGARDEAWEEDSPYALAEMIAWRDFPANRALSFPLVFDAMENIERYRDDVREGSGISELNKQAVLTRLEADLVQ